MMRSSGRQTPTRQPKQPKSPEPSPAAGTGLTRRAWLCRAAGTTAWVSTVTGVNVGVVLNWLTPTTHVIRPSGIPSQEQVAALVLRWDEIPVSDPVTVELGGPASSPA
jgi:hypothetical protein